MSSNGEDTPYGDHTGKPDCPCKPCTRDRIWRKTQEKIEKRKREEEGNG